MSKSVEQRLDELRELEHAPDLAARLPAFLKLKNCRVIKRAAVLAGDKLVYEVEGDLVAAFEMLAARDHKADPNCMAKVAICRALAELVFTGVAFYQRHVHFVQIQPEWGGGRDTGAAVRALCAMGLVASGSPRALADIAHLLFDPELPARLGAVEAVACANPVQAEIMLRSKLFAGDVEAEVMGRCCSALLEIEPDANLALVIGLLEHRADEDLCNEAALALGESSLPAALRALQDSWQRGFLGAPRDVLAQAIALNRSDDAFAWLLAQAECADGPLRDVIEQALQIYHRNQKRAARLTEVFGRVSPG